MQLLQTAVVYQDIATVEPLQQVETVSVTWLHIMMLVYVCGIIFLSVRNIYSAIRICRLIRKGKRQKIENGITLAVHNKNVAPFSWFGYIVISEKDYNENGNEIIAHEKAHILKRHSIDLLLCNIYNIIEWINPVSWLFKREMQNIHEYEADEAVIKKGINAKQYQMLLIKKAAGTKLFALANNFNKNKLKKRIEMMSKQKSNPCSRLKYLYVLPVFAIVVTAFANPHVKNEMKKISSVSISDFIPQNEIGENTVPNSADSTVIIVINQTQINDYVKTDTAYFTANMAENNNDTIIVFNENADNNKSDLDVMFIVDDKIVDSMNYISESKIRSVSVIKNAAQADNTTKSFVFVKTSDTPNKLTAYAYNDSILTTGYYYMLQNQKKTSDSISNTNKHRMLTDMYSFNIDSLNIKIPQIKVNIDSINKNKMFSYINFNVDSISKTFPKLYYYNTDSLKNINWYSDYNTDSLKNFNINWYSDDDFNQYDIFNPYPLVIFDGKELKFEDIAKIGTQIGTITVLKNEEETIKKYGQKAKNGVIIIETKK
jgi:hypothetical protein